jgi:hypothetical protein
MKVIAAILLFFTCAELNAQAIWTSRPKSSIETEKPKSISDFQKTLSSWIFYRGLPIENENQGMLTALFIIDKNRKAKYIHIIKSPDDQVSYLVIYALKKGNFPDSLISDQPYIQPINFKIFYRTPNSYDFAPTHSADSLQAKLSPAISINSGLFFNPYNMAKPNQKPIILPKIVQTGYKREPQIIRVQ